MAALSLVPFPNVNLADVPAKLRELADYVESGVAGDVSCVAISMFGDSVEVYSFGHDSSATTTHVVLHAGMMKLAQALIDGAD